MKIKVDRAELLSALKEKQRETQSQFEKETAAFPKKLAVAKETCLKQLLAATEALKKAVTRKEINSALDYVTAYRSFPQIPEEPKRDTKVDDIIKRLRLCAEETLILREDDDYFRYV